MGLIQTIFLYFFVIMGIIFIGIIIIVIISTIWESRNNKKYIQFKQDNIGKVFFIYGKYKNSIIKDEILAKIDSQIVSLDMNIKDNTQDFDGIPRFIVEKLHEESYYNTHKKDSPYIVTILERLKNRDHGNMIDAVSLKNILGREKGVQEVISKIEHFIKN